MQQLSIVQDYILNAILNHRVVKPMGSSGTVWAGVDFSRDIGVVSNEHDVVRDLYEAIEDWLLMTLRNGDNIPVLDGVDLNSSEGQQLVAWHAAHRREANPEQAWFRTDEWQAGERRVSEQLAVGETTVYRTDNDFLRSLEDESPEV